jgi:hypothetical protein
MSTSVSPAKPDKSKKPPANFRIYTSLDAETFS